MGNKQSLESAFDTANDVYHEIKRKQQEQQQGGQQSQGQYPGSYSHPQGQYLQPSHGAPYQQQPHQQHQNNHQGYQNNHQESQNNLHGNHIASPHLDEGDDPEYTRLRNLAHQEALARNDCYQRSQAAYNGGDGAEG
jgi:hypothetical protein